MTFLILHFANCYKIRIQNNDMEHKWEECLSHASRMAQTHYYFDKQYMWANILCNL